MSKEINLLQTKNQYVSQKAKGIRTARRAAIISLIFIVVVSLTLLAVNQLSGVQADVQKEQAETQSITGLQKNIGEFLLIKDRLKDIAVLLKNQSQLDNTMQQLAQEVPKDARIDSFALNSKTFSMTVISESLSSVNQVQNTITDMVNSKHIVKTLTIDGIVADPITQKYTLSIEGTLL